MEDGVRAGVRYMASDRTNDPMSERREEEEKRRARRRRQREGMRRRERRRSPCPRRKRGLARLLKGNGEGGLFGQVQLNAERIEALQRQGRWFLWILAILGLAITQALLRS